MISGADEGGGAKQRERLASVAVQGGGPALLSALLFVAATGLCLVLFSLPRAGDNLQALNYRLVSTRQGWFDGLFASRPLRQATLTV